MISNTKPKPVTNTRGHRCAAGSRDVLLYLIDRFPDKFEWQAPLPNQRFALPPVSDQVIGAFDKLEQLICDNVPLDEQEQYFYAIHHLMKWEGIYTHYETVRQERTNGPSKARSKKAATKAEPHKKDIVDSIVIAHWQSNPEDAGRSEVTAKAIQESVNARLAEEFKLGRVDVQEISLPRLATRIRNSFPKIDKNNRVGNAMENGRKS